MLDCSRVHRFGGLMALCLWSGLLVMACQPAAEQQKKEVPPGPPHVTAASPVEAGRYLVTLGGCNDCHTNGFLMTEGNVPEAEWLGGSPLGWRGPWGTTYPPNLRLRVQQMTEDDWVQMLKTRTALPPMPWMDVNKVSESDLRAIYQYILYMGPIGEVMPLAVPPDKEPTTSYISMMPVEPVAK